MSRRCSITSGTPPAMNTCTVGWSRGPFGSASTSRGVARLTRSQSSTVGGRSPAACAMAGTCSRRLVEPPNAACSSIAFSIARGVRMAASAVPCAASRDQRVRPNGRASVQPDRLARRRERAVRQRDPKRLGHHLRGGGRPEELASTARRSARAAAQFGRLVRADETVREPRADRLDLARVLGARRRQRHPAGHDDAGQMAAAGQREHHGRQALVARRDAHHAGPPPAAIGSGAAGRWPRRCGTAGCRTSPSCPACGRRTGRCNTRRTARRPACAAPPPPRGRAGRSPSGRCDTRARRDGRRLRAARPGC